MVGGKLVSSVSCIWDCRLSTNGTHVVPPTGRRHVSVENAEYRADVRTGVFNFASPAGGRHEKDSDPFPWLRWVLYRFPAAFCWLVKREKSKLENTPWTHVRLTLGETVRSSVCVTLPMVPPPKLS